MAVYTPLSDDALAAFLADYDLGALVSFSGIAEGVENSNFHVETTAGRFVLTLYERRVNPDDLPYFLDLMRHLARRGIQCPQPVDGRDGNALRRVADRPAAIFTFLNGVWPRRPRPAHCLAVGRALARFHAAGHDFSRQRPNALSLDGWEGLAAACAERAGAVRPGLVDVLRAELTFLRGHWPDALPAGVCHADLFPDNVFFLGGEVSGLIDFYFACHDLWAYDLAICLNAWCFERDGAMNVTKARRLFEGYESVRPLTEAERAALPILTRGAALRFLLTRLYDWLHAADGALVRPKDPLEFLERLQFHQKAGGPEAYGLDGAG